MHSNQLAGHFGPLMGYCDHQVQALMARMLRQYDVSPMQGRTLTFLCESEAPVNQKTLEKFLMVKPSTVNGVVERLEEKGLICRMASAEDARCRILQLTERGRQFYDDFIAIMQRVNDVMESPFSEEERATLHALLLRLAETLTREVNQ